MNIIFTCGGTAGHINPALAVASAMSMLREDCKFLFIGAQGRMETDLVPRAGYEIKTIDISNIHRSLKPSDIVHNIKTLFKVIKSKGQAKKIIKDFNADVVIGTGGYVCYPVVKAAAELGIPTAIHESNAVPGLTTKMLESSADLIMVGFEECIENYSQAHKVLVTGTPVRAEFYGMGKKEAKNALGLSLDKPLLVSVWGSLGASQMNKVVGDFIALACEDPFFELMHSTGKNGFARMKDALSATAPHYKEMGINISDYIYEMPLFMMAADLVICRAGSSTLAELAAAGAPAILVPSPNVTDNHQEANARVLENAGAAKVILESELSADVLLDVVSKLLKNPEQLGKMAQNMEKLAVSDSASIIASHVLALVK